MSASLDYQEIEYSDRIINLSYLDTVDYQFSLMLAATGATRANYSSKAGSATRMAADAWLASLAPAGPGSNKIARFPTGEVQKVYRQAANISSVWINLFDTNINYEFDTTDWGTFSANLQASYYQSAPKPSHPHVSSARQFFSALVKSRSKLLAPLAS